MLLQMSTGEGSLGPPTLQLSRKSSSSCHACFFILSANGDDRARKLWKSEFDLGTPMDTKCCSNRVCIRHRADPHDRGLSVMDLSLLAL